ncbi:hypothetical protein [Cypionkella sp.]|uniref:hypothetical protein n=1 Tax=Cypionkella sp. TaxID=2811411 RepID=UPI002ABCB479|nr:hypothetical protein [Cypionkella sp.]MDZ4395961.1 hypothetical protein [Cypionkella sp.]
MRLFLVLALVLAGCTWGGGKLAKPDDTANPITGDAIAVTSLDAPAPVPADVAGAGAGLPDPAQPAATPVSEQTAPETPAEEVPARMLSAEELACAKSGGQWSVAGKAGGMSCVRVMKDAGKSCRKQSDCEGSCLARSNSCAPIAPLFGCNEILQDNGAMVTLCID